MAARKEQVSEEVHDFLSKNGQKGGMTTRRLIELGKEAAEKSGEDIGTGVDSEISKEIQRSKSRRSHT